MSYFEKLLRDYVTNPGIAHRYDVDFCENALFKYDTQLLDEVLTQPCALLDVGCGTGRHVLHLAKRHFSVTGLDLSKPMLDVLQRKIADEALMCRLIYGDIRHSQKVQAGFYGAAIAMFSVVGLIGPEAQRRLAFERINRALKPQGQFVFHVHNMFHSLTYAKGRSWFLKSIVGALRGKGCLGDKFIHEYRTIDMLYMHTFRLGEIRRLLNNTGFDLCKIHYLNESRTGKAKGLVSRFLANGFVVSARKRKP